MGAFAKNIVWLVASLAGLVGIGWAVIRYIDNQFGQGVGIIVSAILLGVFLTMAIVFLTMAATNRTHEAAGDDLAHGLQSVARPLVESHRVTREYAKAESAQLAARARLEQIDYSLMQRMAAKMAQQMLVDKQITVEADDWYSLPATQEKDKGA